MVASRGILIHWSAPNAFMLLKNLQEGLTTDIVLGVVAALFHLRILRERRMALLRELDASRATELLLFCLRFESLLLLIGYHHGH